jgi:hypothetical protein
MLPDHKAKASYRRLASDLRDDAAKLGFALIAKKRRLCSGARAAVEQFQDNSSVPWTSVRRCRALIKLAKARAHQIRRALCS